MNESAVSTCRWRGQIRGDRCDCSSPKLRIPPAGVRLDHCGKCYCRDHEPPEKPLVQLSPPKPRTQGPCDHLGRKVPPPPGKDVRKTYHHCDKGLGTVCACHCGVGSTCPSHSDLEETPRSEAVVRPGVVVGTYGMPGLVELQVKTIRQHCGEVPILIADDAGPNPASMAETCRRLGVEFWPNPSRKGHYAGDLSVVGKGLAWATRLGLTHLAKLSQRFVWDRHDWLHQACGLLERSGKSILMQNCMDSGKRLYIRSECFVLDVGRWSKYVGDFDRPELKNPTELYLWDLVHRYFGEQYCPWAELTVNRFEKSSGTVWHCTDRVDAYRALAERHGVTLDAEFTTQGWNHRPDWKRG